MEQQNDQNKQQSGRFNPIGLCIGAGIGLCYGVVTDDMGLGLCMGMSIGLCFSVALGHRKADKEENKK